MGRVLLILLLWLAEVVLVLLFVGGDYIREQVDKEHQYVNTYLGETTAVRMKAETDIWYKENIKETGLEQAVYDYFIPAKNSQTGLEEMSPWLFTWMEGRLESFWWAVYQVIYKFGLFVSWLPYLAPVLIAAIIDGTTTRERKKIGHGYSSPLRYDFAFLSLGLMGFAPLVYFTTPYAIHPLWVPIWAVLVSAALLLLSSNTQQRI